MDWNEYFMRMADFVSTKSKDKSTKCGAVIVDRESNAILSSGYNNPCRGVNDEDPAIHERPEKYFHFEHSERNAIYNAARLGTALEGSKIYITGPPCMDCARAIVQSGISEVYFKEPSEDFKTRWKESYEKSIKLFNDTNVIWRQL